jgi:hypothetical protein
MTIEQTIVDALVERLASIQAGLTVTLNGQLYTYVNTIRTVCDGRQLAFNEAELPAANVFTPEDVSTTVSLVNHDHTLFMMIVLHVANNTAQKTIRTLRQDVYAAIGSDVTLGGVPQLIQLMDPTRVTKCIQMADFIGSEQITFHAIYRSPKWGV